MLELEKKLIDATAKYNCNETNNNTCSNNNIINNTNNRGISNNLMSSHNNNYYDGKTQNNIELQLQNNGMTPLSPSAIASPSSSASTKPICSYVKYLNRTDNKSSSNNYNNDNNLNATSNNRETVPSTINYNAPEHGNKHHTTHSKLLNFLCKENS